MNSPEENEQTSARSDRSCWDANCAARLGAHGVAAAAFVLVALPGLPIILAAALIVTLVGMTNLYNFMDGSGGLQQEHAA